MHVTFLPVGSKDVDGRVQFLRSKPPKDWMSFIEPQEYCLRLLNALISSDETKAD